MPTFMPWRQDQGVAAELDPEALLAEAAWLKRLAVTLAGDADDADDLVQESWIAAWRRSPDIAARAHAGLGPDNRMTTAWCRVEPGPG